MGKSIRYYSMVFSAFSALMFSPSVSAQVSSGFAKEVCKGKLKTSDVRELYIQNLMKNIKFEPHLFLNSNGLNPYASMQSLAEHVEGCWDSRSRSENKNCKPFTAFMTDLDGELPKLTEGQMFRTNHEFTNSTVTSTEVQQFISPDPNKEKDFAVFCTNPIESTSSKPIAEGEPSFNFKNIEITADVASLGKSTSQKKAAEFSLTLDRANKISVTDPNTMVETFEKNEVIETNVTLGLKNLTTIKLNKSSSDYNVYVTPYVSWQYRSNLNPQAEVDNLSLGAKFVNLANEKRVRDFRIPELVDIVYGVGDIELTGAYITDLEQRDSKQWSAELRVEDVVDFHTWVLGFDQGFSITPVVDYSDIDEFDDKINLRDLQSYTRIGYDIDYSAHLFDVSDWKLGFDASYQFRDTISNDPANADFVTAQLQLKPNKGSNFSYGVQYDRGENLISLEEIESWKVTIGYKQ